MKTAIRKLSVFALLAGLSGAVQAAQVFSYTSSSESDGLIPDASGLVGVDFAPGEKQIQFSLSGTESLITDLRVTLDISGYGGPGYSGDLYVYLKKLDAGSGVTSVLLNRVGDGDYNDTGFNVTLATGSTPDIHNYWDVASPDTSFSDNNSAHPGQLIGTWAADGRTSPGAGLRGDARPATLNVFQNVNPNGNWVLYLADYATGAQMTMNSFSLDLTTVAVPEPAQAAMAVGGMLFGLALYRRPGIRNRLASLIRR